MKLHITADDLGVSEENDF